VSPYPYNSFTGLLEKIHQYNSNYKVRKPVPTTVELKGLGIHQLFWHILVEDFL